MLIVYCETCGFRLHEADIASGAAVLIGEHKYLCAKCAVASGRKPQPATKIVSRNTPEGTRTLRPAPDEGRAAPIKMAAPPHILPVASHASGHLRAAPASAKNTQKKKDSTALILGGVCAAIVLVLVFVFAFGGKKDEPKTASLVPEKPSSVPAEPAMPANPAPQKTPAPETPAPNNPRDGDALAPNTPAGAPAAPPGTLQERESAMEKEMEERKVQRAAKLLEEIKAWFQTHPDDPWAYKERLGMLVGTYRSTPAAAEAAKILGELKLPEGEPSPDSMVWQRAWEITRGAMQDMNENFDGHRFVLATHPLAPGVPCIVSRKVKVPDDKPFLEFNIRAHDNGDFKLIVAVDGKTCLSQDIAGRQWLTFALDLSFAKGREVDLSLQHHNTGWNNEHGWWTAPHFVAAASPGARIVAPDGAAVAAPASVAAAPKPAAPVMTPGAADARVWRPLFDGKTLDCLLKQGFNGWRVEDRALVNSGPEKSAAQTQFEIEDGSLRARFEIKDATYAHFTIRQGEQNGYAVSFDRSQLPAMNGKPQEIVFTCRGDEVSATLNGLPATVAPGKTRKGRLQFYARDGVIRVFSLEFAELTAAPATSSGAAPATPGNTVVTPPAGVASAKFEYEQLLADAYALLAKNAVPQALSKLEEAKANPKFSAQRQALDQDVATARYIESARNAVAAGAAKLMDKTPSVLVKNDGKEIRVGSASKNSVRGVKDDTISIDQDLGGGTALFKIPIDDLNPQTQWELARRGLAADAESKVKLAFLAFVDSQAGKEFLSPKAIGALLNEAEKEHAPLILVAHIRERMIAADREIAADAAYRKAVALMSEKKWKEAKAAFENVIAEFDGTRTLHLVRSAMAQQMAVITHGLNPNQQGLWTSYWSGEKDNDFKKFYFSRAETKLIWDWGEGSPDPRVPNDYFGLRFRGILRVAQDGHYRFAGNADDEITLWIDGRQILHNAEADTDLKQGDHDIKIEFQEWTGSAHMDLKWNPPGANGFQAIPPEMLLYDPERAAQYEQP